MASFDPPAATGAVPPSAPHLFDYSRFRCVAVSVYGYCRRSRRRALPTQQRVILRRPQPSMDRHNPGHSKSVDNQLAECGNKITEALYPMRSQRTARSPGLIQGHPECRQRIPSHQSLRSSRSAGTPDSPDVPGFTCSPALPAPVPPSPVPRPQPPLRCRHRMPLMQA